MVSNGVADEMVAKFDEMANGRSLVREMTADEPLKMIWNSRVSNEKRIMPFLQAIAEMSSSVLVSVFGNGNALKKARRYVAKHNLNVKFYGMVPHEEILKQMLAQHLSVTVSYGFDTQGLTLLEAEATGLPVFFVDPDMKEVVPEGGFIFSRPEVVDMARVMDGAYANSEKIMEMSKVMLAHRHEVLQSTQIKKLVKIYTSLKSQR